ncbi:MAG: hypothetical protein IJB52_14950 [Clostridia bacterium]|nr:hypothetical protein [Clostridia bacterium]
MIIPVPITDEKETIAMKKRLLALFIAILAALPLTACGNGQTAETTADTAAAETETAVETEPSFDPMLEAVDYGGEDFVILYNYGNDLEPNKDFVGDTLTGEIVNDAIYNRTISLEDKYNVKMVYTMLKGDGEVGSAIQKAVTAGDSTYAAADINAQFCIQQASKGNLMELRRLPNINLSQPYWSDTMLEGSSICGKNYFTFSDINIHAYGATPCMIFNKVVHENHGLEDLYEIVLDGRWTFDKACELISAVTADLDGDGKITKDDTLGLIANNFCVDCFISGTGFRMIDKDEEDLPVLMMYTEEFANIMDGIKNLLSVETGSFLVDRTSTQTEAREYWTEWAITEDRALFWVGNIKCVERMRQSESDFGVVPMPKASEAQENYAIHVQANIGTMLCFPITLPDADMVSRIIEDMAYISYETVMPAYMDVCIDGKTIRDEESLACLEIIRTSYYCDLGFMFQQLGVNVLGQMRDYVTNNRTDFMSKMAASAKSWGNAVTKIAATFADAEA